jgi:hypothetical protein
VSADSRRNRHRTTRLSHNKPDDYTSGGFKIAIHDPPNACAQWFEVMRRQDNFDYVGPAVLAKELFDDFVIKREPD